MQTLESTKVSIFINILHVGNGNTVSHVDVLSYCSLSKEGSTCKLGRGRERGWNNY